MAGRGELNEANSLLLINLIGSHVSNDSRVISCTPVNCHEKRNKQQSMKLMTKNSENVQS